MITRSLFSTLFYEGQLDDPDLISDLERSARLLAKEDKAGRRWCVEHGYQQLRNYGDVVDGALLS